MKELKKIEIQIANQLAQGIELRNRVSDRALYFKYEAYCKGVIACHKLIVDRISFLEKQ